MVGLCDMFGENAIDFEKTDDGIRVSVELDDGTDMAVLIAEPKYVLDFAIRLCEMVRNSYKYIEVC